VTSEKTKGQCRQSHDKNSVTEEYKLNKKPTLYFHPYANKLRVIEIYKLNTHQYLNGENT